jgi:ketosteroid isomerase-like protein
MSTKEVVEKFMSALGAMDFAGAFGLLAEDAKHVVIGTTPVSRVYNGRQDVFDNLMPALGSFVEPPALKFDTPIIDGDRAVMLASGEGVGPHGSYKQPYYAFVVKVANGEFVEFIEFMDTEMVNSALFGKKHES